ncbi:MAG: hypothetical protein EA347_02645 [Thioalkalivibrio sp.]|nr:MAG: hypothetical protein EA347_02645 [Thioalkalivibrio sp.]
MPDDVTSLWLFAAWALGLALMLALVVGLLWLRLRRIRLQVEARYLEAVADHCHSDQPNGGAERFARIPGARVRGLLHGLSGPGLVISPATWQSRGWLRYDGDDRERRVSAQTWCVPGQWWAQIRRVRLRIFGWIDEIHEVEQGVVRSHYWWFGLFRVNRPGFGPSPLAVQAQAIGETALVPWGWFVEGAIDWETTEGNEPWRGGMPATGHGILLFLDRAGRPATIDLQDPAQSERMRVELGGWRWSGRALLPDRLRLIESVGSVNEFVRMEMRLAVPERVPPAGRRPDG